MFGMTNGVLEYWNLATMSRVASWQVHEGKVSHSGIFSGWPIHRYQRHKRRR